ncbi:uncharacterized protein [Palaemon carinicauda]|uniref:uncharacterized protein n=1 Tax=Palaemon carinicauda TaxID=392227 RepID=UPI0035B5E114
MGLDDPAKNIRFVREIEKYPCIYNNTLLEYSNKEATDNAWLKVATEMDDTVQNCKEKWRNLRTVFVRKMKLPLCHGPSSRKNTKPYYLTSAMQFLVPYVKTQQSHVSGNYVSKGEEEEKEKEKDALRSESDDEQLLGFERNGEILDISAGGGKSLATGNAVEDDVTEDGDTLPPSLDRASAEVRGHSAKTKIPPKRLSTPSANDHLCTDFINMKRSRMYDDEDPRRQFLLSLLPDVHAMTDAQMRKFKKSVMEVVDKILDEPVNNTSVFSTTQVAVKGHFP